MSYCTKWVLDFALKLITLVDDDGNGDADISRKPAEWRIEWINSEVPLIIYYFFPISIPVGLMTNDANPKLVQFLRVTVKCPVSFKWFSRASPSNKETSLPVGLLSTVVTRNCSRVSRRPFWHCDHQTSSLGNNITLPKMARRCKLFEIQVSTSGWLEGEALCRCRTGQWRRGCELFDRQDVYDSDHFPGVLPVVGATE